MKKWIVLLLAATLLSGCGKGEQPEPETIPPTMASEPERPTAGELQIWLPEEAVAETMADGEQGQVYSWDSYELRLQTKQGGDIRRTLEELTGKKADQLTVLSRSRDALDFYQTVWCTTDEEGTLVHRTAVVSDGVYHYCMSLSAPEQVDCTQMYDRLCSTLSVQAPGEKS